MKNKKNIPFFRITSAWGENHQNSNSRLIDIITGKIKKESEIKSARVIRTASSLRKPINIFLQDNRSIALSSKNCSRSDLCLKMSEVNKISSIPIVSNSSKCLSLNPSANKKYRSTFSSFQKVQDSENYRKASKKVQMIQQLRETTSQKQLFRNRLLSGAMSGNQNYNIDINKNNENFNISNLNNIENQQQEQLQKIYKQNRNIKNASKRLTRQKIEIISNFKVDYQAFNYLNKVFQMPDQIWRKYVHQLKSTNNRNNR